MSLIARTSKENKHFRKPVFPIKKCRDNSVLGCEKRTELNSAKTSDGKRKVCEENEFFYRVYLLNGENQARESEDVHLRRHRAKLSLSVFRVPFIMRHWYPPNADRPRGMGEHHAHSTN